MAQQPTYKRLARSKEGYIGGVCAGIAEYLEFDPIVIRVLFILCTITTAGLGALAYLALWALLPRATEPQAPYEVMPESAESSVYGSLDFDEQVGAPRKPSDDDYGSPSMLQRLGIAVGLMIAYLLAATGVAPIVSGTQWWQFWPLALLVVGLCLVVVPVRSRFESLWHAAGIVVTSVAATILPMSLGVLSWETLALAASRLWPLLAIAVVVAVIGLRRHAGSLVVLAALVVVVFCLAAIVLYGLSADVGALIFDLPDGRSLRIAMH